MILSHEWRETLHDEWFCDDLDVIIVRRGKSWSGYSFRSGERFGPYSTLDEAKARIADAVTGSSRTSA
jgi:hypothetical protein